MNIAFTICAKNYIGLAQVLESSINKYCTNVSFYIFVADEFDSNLSAMPPENAFISKNVLSAYISTEQWNEMSFKYNLTEFCTFIKPFCFQYLFDRFNGQKIIYLDPDILFFSDINLIFNQLDTHNIVITPHILKLSEIYDGDRSELGILSTGVFNLGFLGLSNSLSSMNFLSWWGERLKKFCFIDPLEGSFTDQRWIDFLPCFYNNSDLLISQDLGLNLAPWNFYERRLIKENGDIFKVVFRKSDNSVDSMNELKFVHFSGYNYESLMSGNFVQKNIPNLKLHEDLIPIFSEYKKALKNNENNIISFFNLNYSYNYFDNGIKITNLHRRLFRASQLDEEESSNPFITNEFSFFNKLKNANLISRNSSNVDILNKQNIPNMHLKMKAINFFMRVLFKFIGVDRYVLLVRFFRPYSRLESHFFLLNNKRNSI